MLETNTFKEIIKILSETDYSYSIISLDSELMYEEILISELKRVYKFVREISKTEQKIVDILALKHEYQNLKLRLKNDLSSSDLNKHIFDTDLSDKEMLNKNYLKIKGVKDIKVATILLDKLYLEHVLKLANELDFDIFKKYAQILIDRYNVCSFLRMKYENQNIDNVENILIDGGKISLEDLIKIYLSNTYDKVFKKTFDSKVFDKLNIAEIEKFFDDEIMKLALEYKNVNICT